MSGERAEPGTRASRLDTGGHGVCAHKHGRINAAQCKRWERAEARAQIGATVAP